jgi:fluoroquinolone transport system permease protein
MRRLLATARLDVQLQVRYGFYAATGFILVVWAVLLSQLPGLGTLDLGWLLPAFVAENLLLSTFYFIGGLVLLERGEGTLEARVVTPLRVGEYLASKVITLTLLSAVENVLLAGFLLQGPRFALLPLVTGIALASALYVLVGFVAVARYASINEYLLPSIFYTTLLSLPLFPYLGRWETWLVYVHPLQPALVVMRAAFEPVEGWQMMYGLAYGGLWIGLLATWSRRDFLRFVVARAGGR